VSTTTHHQICPVCEATCGLALQVRDKRVVGIRGNPDDVLTLGHVCPKGVALMELGDDPDRLRTPMVRRNGRLEPATWDEAFAVIGARLAELKAQHGAQSLALFIGNATIGTTAFTLGYPLLLAALGTPQLYTAGSFDHLPKLFVCQQMYGHQFSNPVPDIDRAEYLLVIGANPMVSNGSLWLATGFRTRVKSLQGRGGRLVVIDPRRSETAKIADRHHFIRPGRDPYFLLGLIHVLCRDHLSQTGPIQDHLAGLSEIEALAAAVDLPRLSGACGIAAADIEAIAHTLATTARAGVYGRVGATTQEHGTVTSWLIEVVNILAGNLDREGGMMFPKPAAFAANTQGRPGSGEADGTEPYRTRVRQKPAVCGELPAACLAEEILTPGDGRIRGLVTLCGNPALSAPNAALVDRALAGLDFMLSFDIYINETTRHADVILPGAPTFEKSYYGAYSANYAVRNVARCSPAVFEPAAETVSDWDALLQVCSLAVGGGQLDEAGLLAMENQLLEGIINQTVNDEYSVACGVTPAEALALLSPRRGMERVLDAGFRTGPYGDGFGRKPDGITLEKIMACPNGLDLGPLQPRVPEVLRTPSGKIEVAPPAFLSAAWALLQSDPEPTADGMFLLIGRRQPRSINTWGHNVNILAGGGNRCTLQVNPADAARLNVTDGDRLRLSTAAGELIAPVEQSDDLMPGVVSLPHGWGHSVEGIRLNLAGQKPGVNINVLMDETRLDALTGNAVLSAVPVVITALD